MAFTKEHMTSLLFQWRNAQDNNIADIKTSNHEGKDKDKDYNNRCWCKRKAEKFTATAKKSLVASVDAHGCASLRMLKCRQPSCLINCW